MSTSPDAMQQLLGGLLNYTQPSVTQGLLSGNDPTTNFGLSLLANSNSGGRFGQILGQSALQTQQQGNQNAMQKLQIADALQNLQMKSMQQNMFMKAYPAYLSALGMGGQTGQPSTSQDPSMQGSMAPSQGSAQTASMPQQFAGASASQAPQDPLAMVKMGAIGAALGMPGAKEMQELGKTQAQYNPGLATQMKAAESEISQLVTLRDQAAGRKDYATAAGIDHKLQEAMGLIHVGQMSGTVTQFGPGGVNTLDPNTGIATQNGVASLAPGFAAAAQQKAGAEALGRAQGELTEVTDAAGNKYSVPRSTLLGGATRGPMAPQLGAAPQGPLGALPAATPGPMASIGPAQTEMLKGNAQQALGVNKAYQDQVEAGQQMLTNTAELRHAAADFTPGKFADSRATFLDLLNSANLITAKEKNELGSAQVGQKIAIQLQAAATKQLGSREAAQIFSIMGKSLPNLTLSPDGLEKVSSYLDGMARYNIARGQVSQQRASQNDVAGVNNVRSEFIQNTNPLYFIIASAAPDQQKEMLNAMGGQKASFLQKWNAAANAGWAPRPGAYNGGS